MENFRLLSDYFASLKLVGNPIVIFFPGLLSESFETLDRSLEECLESLERPSEMLRDFYVFLEMLLDGYFHPDGRERFVMG